MSRPKERIEPLLNRLREAWLTAPELRLGQIVANASNEIRNDFDPFYIEDEALIIVIEKQLKERLKR